MKLSLGIDLGTSNCALAYVDEAGVLKSFKIRQLVAAGELSARELLPSCLYRPSEAELAKSALALPWDASASDVVGLFARSQGASTPTRLVSSAKSWLSHSAVDRTTALLPWSAPSEVQRISPLEASARYLAHLRCAWDEAHPQAPLVEQDVVLTVPASFDAVARELTVEAARKAGFSESLRLLEEPQAALYAWLAHRGSAWRDDVVVGEVILVVDVGGGTTDFSLIAVGEESGELTLERVAVGEHILLGGDNMDLALAYAARSKLEQTGARLDDWQMRSLTYACRVAKEALLSDPSLTSQPLVVPGRSSKLIGGSLRTELSREELEALLLDGFFPEVDVTTRPATHKRVGLTALGLPFASDAAITRHLAAFLGRDTLRKPNGASFLRPTAILYNGGVMRSPILRERVTRVLSRWAEDEGGKGPRVLESADLDLATSRGAAHYAHVRKNGGVRIRSGTAQAYYVGVERNELPVPGMPPALDALCIAPAGMEEGSEAELATPFGLVLGEPVSFRFFASDSRTSDAVGTVVDPRGLEELAPIETALAAEREGVTEVRLHARVTEVGTLELSAIEPATSQRWKLSFNVRVE